MTSTGTLVKWGALSLVIALVVVGGIMVAMALATAQRGGTVVVLVGLSPSEQPDAKSIDACATEAAHQAVDDGATLKILPIGRSPAQLRTPPSEGAVGLWDRMDTSEFDETKKRLYGEAEERIRQIRAARPPVGASDTLAALSIAGDQLDKADAPRTVVVCGDAHQVGAINLYDTQGRSCQELLHAASADLRTMSHARVVFAAPGADDPHRLPLAEERVIERFWKTCWAPAVRANGLEYRHGATG